MPLRDHRFSWAQRKSLHESLTRRAAVLREGRERADIDAALARLETAGFGACAGCGAPIAWDRLVARPEVRHCTRCQVAGTP